MHLQQDQSVDNNQPKPDRQGSTALSHLAMLAVVIVWGLSFVSTKVLTEPPADMSPVGIYIYRFVLAYLVVLAINHKRFVAHSVRDELLFVVLGLCGGSLYFIAENVAVTQTLVGNVSLLTTLSPLITVFLIGLLYKNEKPSRWMVLGSLLALGGVAFVVFGASGSTVEIHPVGDLLAIGAAFSFSVYSIVLRMVTANYDALFITRKTFFYGIVTALPFIAFEPVRMPGAWLLEPSVWLNLLFLGIMCSMLAYIFMSIAVKRLGAVTANNYLYGQSIITLIAGWVILGQKVGWNGWVGCALIIAGLWLGEYLSRREKAD